MKMQILTAAMGIALSFSATAGSYAFGKVSELVIQGDRATFQIDTSAGFSQIDSQCNQNAPLNFVIDFQNQPAASALLDAVKEAKASQTNVGVNGQGNCFTGGEFETVDSIAI